MPHSHTMEQFLSLYPRCRTPVGCGDGVAVQRALWFPLSWRRKGLELLCELGCERLQEAAGGGGPSGRVEGYGTMNLHGSNTVTCLPEIFMSPPAKSTTQKIKIACCINIFLLFPSSYESAAR